MKLHNIKCFLITLAAVICTSCINDDDYTAVKPSYNKLTATKTVLDIYNMASGTPKEYIDNDIIEAYVSSSDEERNFYKTISFQTLDKTLGFSIPVDVYNTYTDFKPGRKVFIRLQGLYYNIQNNNLVIGAKSNQSIGSLSKTQYHNTIKASATIIPEEELAKEISIEEINDSHINILVKLKEVQFTNAVLRSTYYESKNDIGGATNHLLEDKNGNTLIVRTSSFASFAEKHIPEGSGTIQGIITKYRSDYQLIIRFEDDAKLIAPRF